MSYELHASFVVVQELGVVVAPEESAVLDVRFGEGGMEGWGEGADESPLLIIYARARGADGCADGVNDDDAVAGDERVACGGGGVWGRYGVLAHCREGEEEQGSE